MKKLIKTLSLCAMALKTCVLSTSAANVDEATGTFDNGTWKYWNENQNDNNVFFPNWQFLFSGNDSPHTYSPKLEWTIDGDNGYSESRTENPSWAAADVISFYASLGELQPGNYTTVSKMTWTEGGQTKEIVVPTQNWTVSGISEKFNVTLTIDKNGEFTPEGATGGKMPFKITATGDVDAIDHFVVWASRAGDEEMDPTNFGKDVREGELILTKLPANADTDIWIKVKAVSASGKETPTVQAGGFQVSTKDPSLPSATIEATEPTPTGGTTGTLRYTITATNADMIQNYAIKVVTNAFGNGDVTVCETTTTETSGTLQLTGLKLNSKNELWVKMTVNLTDGGTLEEVTYPGAAQGWTGLSITTSESGIQLPEITKLEITAPTATGPTTGTLAYEITATNAENIKNLHIWAVTNVFGNGDVTVCDINTTDLTGILNLSGLKPGVQNDLWVKVEATTIEDGTIEMVQFPGAAQGWGGLSITTPGDGSAIVTGLNITDAKATTSTTAEMNYEVLGSGFDKVASYAIRVVTDGDAELYNGTATEPTGKIVLENLTPGTTYPLWVKVIATNTDGVALEEVQYPGAAQGWYGLEITTPDAGDAIEAIESDSNADAIYYTLQGVRVGNPTTGLFIVVKDGRASKVFVN